MRLATRILGFVSLVVIAVSALQILAIPDRISAVPMHEPVDVVAFLGNAPLEVSWSPVQLPLSVSRSQLECFGVVVAASPDGELESKARSRLLHFAHLLSLRHVRPDWLVVDGRGIVTKALLPTSAFQVSWRGLEVAESWANARNIVISC